MARWVIALVGDAPCQCRLPGEIHTTSPGRISSMGPPSICTRPTPTVTISVCPSGCVCHALRAPGSNVTYAPDARVDSFAWKSGSMRTDPVKYSVGPFCEGCVPTRAMERETTVDAATMFISVLSILASLLREQLFGARCGRHRARPPGVEREVGDELDELFLRHAVLDRSGEVEVHLLCLAGRDERRAGDQAAVALRELRPLPDVAEQHLLGDLDE